jgi:hypothetical protein
MHKKQDNHFCAISRVEFLVFSNQECAFLVRSANHMRCWMRARQQDDNTNFLNDAGIKFLFNKKSLKFFGVHFLTFRNQNFFVC